LYAFAEVMLLSRLEIFIPFLLSSLLELQETRTEKIRKLLTKYFIIALLMQMLCPVLIKEHLCGISSVSDDIQKELTAV